jgi:hypothetical protein
MTPEARDRAFQELVRLSKQLLYTDGPGWAERYRADAESGDVYRALGILIDIHRRLVKLHSSDHLQN